MVGVPDWVSQGKYGGVVPMGILSLPDKWDIHQSCCVSGPAGGGSIWNNLLVYNPVNTDQLIGDLAESWELSADNMSYTFHLTDATWWDGQPVTAEDVKFSIDRWAEDGVARPRVRRVKGYVSDAEVIDPKTVKLNLLFPGAPALQDYLAVSFMKIYPKHWVETLPQLDPEIDFEPLELLGSGSFKPSKYSRGNSWEMEKNENYWKEDRPFFDGYRVTGIKDNARKIAAIRTEQILMWVYATAGLSIKDGVTLREELKEDWDFPFVMPPIAGLMMNINRKPFDDERVRRAVSIAIDRKEILDGWGFGQGWMGSPFPPGSWYAASDEEVATWPGYRYVDSSGAQLTNVYVKGAQKDPRDMEEAKQLLADAGYPDGIKDVNLINHVVHKEGAAIVLAQLKRIGIEATPMQPEPAVYLARQADGDFDMMFTRYGLNIVDPDDILGAHYLPGGSRNRIEWTDDELIELAEQQRREPDLEKRKALLGQIEQIIVSGKPHYTPILWAQFYFRPLNKKINNFQPCQTLQLCLTFENLWLDEQYHSQFK
jgi:ABC-type transport system substrate-binding protein